MVHDLSAAEDLAQDALVAALEQWPRDGIPTNPAAWLTAVVKRRAVDRLRRADRLRQREPELVRRAAEQSASSGDIEVDRIEDDLLRLLFISCHPAITQQARVALTLRLLGGLTTAEIAHAFLVPEPTVAQRIVRAKKELARVGADMDEPGPQERVDRLPAVLETVYLIFNEEYNATAGYTWTRPELCSEALRLARLLRGLLPNDSEVLGLLALLELQSPPVVGRTRGPRLPVFQCRTGTASVRSHARRGGDHRPARWPAEHARNEVPIVLEARGWLRGALGGGHDGAPGCAQPAGG